MPTGDRDRGKAAAQRSPTAAIAWSPKGGQAILKGIRLPTRVIRPESASAARRRCGAQTLGWPVRPV